MTRNITIFLVLGTRPEAIKLAPLALVGRQRKELKIVLCNTGQHRQMSDQALKLFDLRADVDLNIMKDDQTLTDITGSILSKLQATFKYYQPDWIVVQGDTTTAFAAALAAFYEKLPVAHVEAGLRSGNIYAPWPEEMNRRLITQLTTMHFPPTQSAAEALRAEGIPESKLLVTGNTGIDALKWMMNKLSDNPSLCVHERSFLTGSAGTQSFERPYVLITCHRRESFGPGLETICMAIGRLAKLFPAYDFIYPVHPNPHVRQAVHALLGRGQYANVQLINPLDYLPFVCLMSRAELILTDSGGIQEEAPSLGKRVVVLRNETERTEGLKTGFIRLAGADFERIVAYTHDALSGIWVAPAAGSDVYGDGNASDRILDCLRAFSGDVI